MCMFEIRVSLLLLLVKNTSRERLPWKTQRSLPILVTVLRFLGVYPGHVTGRRFRFGLGKSPVGTVISPKGPEVPRLSLKVSTFFKTFGGQGCRVRAFRILSYEETLAGLESLDKYYNHKFPHVLYSRKDEISEYEEGFLRREERFCRKLRNDFSTDYVGVKHGHLRRGDGLSVTTIQILTGELVS